jgi:tetratricopeptide (TPR) repeat protein
MRIYYIFIIFSIYQISFSEKFDAGNKNSNLFFDTKIPNNSIPTQKEKAAPRKNLDALMEEDGSSEKKFIDGIDKAIPNLKNLSEKMSKGSENRLAILNKIVHLLFEKSIYNSKEEQKEYNKKWDIWDKSDKKTMQPKLDQRLSAQSWNQYIKQSYEIISEYPKFKDIDKVYYQIALAYQFLGDEKKSIVFFKKITENYKKSNYLGDSYFFIAEHFFDAHSYNQALDEYKKSLVQKNPKRYGWVLFKIGWCYYNLSSYQMALDFWKKTVDFSKNQKSYSRLKEDVMRDMAYAFAELNQVDEAIQFYKKNQGNRYIPKFLKLLGTIFYEHGKFKKSIDVWKRLLAEDPLGEEAIEAKKYLSRIHFETRRFLSLFYEIKSLFTEYSVSSPWGVKNKNLAKEEWTKIKDIVIFYAKKAHEQAQKTKNEKDYIAALKLYELYIKYANNPENSNEIFEYIGDILYVLKKYEHSGLFYKKITSLGKEKAYITVQNKKVNIHQRSSKNMLDAYYQAALPELKILVQKKPLENGVLPIHQTVKKFINACSIYEKFYPSDLKEIKDCDIYNGDIYLKTGYREAAVAALSRIALRYPQGKEGPVAAENLIALLLKDKDKNRSLLKKILEDLVKIPQYKNSPIGVKLINLLGSLKLEDIEGEKDLSKRAVLYEQYVDSSESSSEKGEALYLAARAYIKSGKIKKARESYEKIIEKGDQSASYKQALIDLAKLLDLGADLEPAASYYLAFGKKYPKEKDSPLALARGCEILVAIESEKIMTACGEFFKFNPDLSEPILYSYMMQKWRVKDYASLSYAISSYYLILPNINENQKMIAYFFLLKKAENQQPKDQNFLKKIHDEIYILTQSGKLKGEALRYGGEILFQKAMVGHEDFYSKRLQGESMQMLQRSIADFMKYLEKFEKKFSPLFQLQDSYWAVSAFYELGKAYEYFASQMADPPPIKEAPLEAVKEQLKSSVAQLKEKYLIFYKKGGETYEKYDVYSDYAILLKKKIDQFSEKKQSFDDWVIEPEFVSSEITSPMILGKSYDE